MHGGDRLEKKMMQLSAHSFGHLSRIFVSPTGCVLASAHVACRAAVTLVVRKVLPPNRRHGRNGLKNEKKRPGTPRET